MTEGAPSAATTALAEQLKVGEPVPQKNQVPTFDVLKEKEPPQPPSAAVATPPVETPVLTAARAKLPVRKQTADGVSGASYEGAQAVEVFFEMSEDPALQPEESSRFQATSPADVLLQRIQKLENEKRWLIGGMLALVLLIVIALILTKYS